jgi:O-antigen ligase
MFVIMPKSVLSINQWSPYFWLGTVIALSATIYSYLKESSLYIDILSSGTISSQIVSYTNNRNTYGTLLLVGIICSCFYAVFANKKWFLLISFYFWFNLVLVGSKSAFFCSTFFLLAFIVWEIVKNFRGHPVKSSFSIPVLLSFVVFMISVSFFGSKSNVVFLQNLSLYLTKNFGFVGASSTSSISTRFSIWQRLLQILGSSPTFLTFGVGDWNLSWLLGFNIYSGETIIGSAHSGFADVLGRFGIFGLILYLGLISWFFVKIKDPHIRPTRS